MVDTTALPALPRDEGGPVFAEPWQAHAFALAVRLSEAGVFTWGEWAQALGAELAAAEARGEPDDSSCYYHHWLAALERLVAAKDVVTDQALLVRKEEWAKAYRRTPHGQPVALEPTQKAPQPNPLPAGGEREGPAPAPRLRSDHRTLSRDGGGRSKPGGKGG
jgi:nitrile hydratase accessory protein